MKSNKPLIEFDPKLPKLSKNEKAVLKILIEVARLIVPIYLKQENRKFPGANFYPHDASKKEIEMAAKENKDILSPYTVVERVKGKLVSVPYHAKYAFLLKPIADKLKEAARITENKEFAKALNLQAKALVEGTYEEALKQWLKMEPYILDISIGPSDNYNDHLFFAKASYQAWVGVLDREGTERLNNYKSVALSPKREGLVPNERVDNYDRVKAKVDEVVIFSGLMARTKFVGINLPADANLVEKYGSEITLFNQANDLRMKEQIMPTFERIFPKEFKEGFSHEDLRRGYLRAVAMHELAHSYLHYRNAITNLRDLFPVIDELAATVFGLRIGGLLLLKDRINNKQLESMIVTFLCRSFYHLSNRRPNKYLISYVLGGTIFINFMLENGALKQWRKIVVPNFMKIFVALHELSDILENLLAKGSYKDAEVFIRKYP